MIYCSVDTARFPQLKEDIKWTVVNWLTISISKEKSHNFIIRTSLSLSKVSWVSNCVVSFVHCKLYPTIINYGNCGLSRSFPQLIHILWLSQDVMMWKSSFAFFRQNYFSATDAAAFGLLRFKFLSSFCYERAYFAVIRFLILTDIQQNIKIYSWMGEFSWNKIKIFISYYSPIWNTHWHAYYPRFRKFLYISPTHLNEWISSRRHNLLL